MLIIVKGIVLGNRKILIFLILLSIIEIFYIYNHFLSFANLNAWHFISLYFMLSKIINNLFLTFNIATAYLWSIITKVYFDSKINLKLNNIQIYSILITFCNSSCHWFHSNIIYSLFSETLSIKYSSISSACSKTKII